VTQLGVVLCGRTSGFAGDGFPIDSSTRLSKPVSVVQASGGAIYFLDQRNQRIRRIDPSDVITTVVGSATDGDGNGLMDPGFAGDGGSPLQALVSFPTGSNPVPGGGLAIDAQGRLYFSDTNNQRVRRADLQLDLIETVIGTGIAGFSGDDGPGTAASLNTPRDLEFRSAQTAACTSRTNSTTACAHGTL
jgi:hypothetical protein